MRKICLLAVLCILCVLSGCQKQPGSVQEQPRAGVRIALSAWRYEEGYQPAEGWVYDLYMESEEQIAGLTALADAVGLTARDEAFEFGTGYLITFTDAAGAATREMLVLPGQGVSIDGLMYDAAGTEALTGWLEELKLDEQDVA